MFPVHTNATTTDKNLDLRLRKTRTGKLHDYREAILFKKFHFQNIFRQREKRKGQRFQFFPIAGRPNRGN